MQWADVESLIEELQKIDGVVGVSKGRFFLSPGLTPTFQVWSEISSTYILFQVNVSCGLSPAVYCENFLFSYA